MSHELEIVRTGLFMMYWFKVCSKYLNILSLLRVHISLFA